MAIRFLPKANNAAHVRCRPRGHVQPKAPDIDLSGPGRLRTAHVLALCGISHSTLYARMRDGLFPQPDGREGHPPAPGEQDRRRIYWNTETIRVFLSQ